MVLEMSQQDTLLISMTLESGRLAYKGGDTYVALRTTSYETEEEIFIRCDARGETLLWLKFSLIVEKIQILWVIEIWLGGIGIYYITCDVGSGRQV